MSPSRHLKFLPYVGVAFFLLNLLISISPLRAGEENSPLAKKLIALAKAHKGKVAIAVKHLDSGESFYYHADEVMPTASLIKFPILLEVYLQVMEGKIKLDDPVTLREEDKVPGSGILTEHFSAGLKIPLRDAVRLMIAFSDNTATNLVLDRIGIPSTNKRMAKWSYPETRINAKVFRGSTTSINPERTKKYGLGSTRARDMVELLEKLYREKIATPAACKEMIGHLKKCQDKNMFPRLLPAGTIVAHKTGAVTNARTDAGIIYPKNGSPILLCVLTNENQDRRWTRDNAGELLCARIAKEVFDYFGEKKK